MRIICLKNADNEDENALRYPVELINSLEVYRCLPDHQLGLRREFIVVLISNLNPSCGYFNEPRYVEEEISRSIMYLSLVTGPNKGKRLA